MPFTKAGFQVKQGKTVVKQKPAPKNKKIHKKKKRKGPGKPAVVSVCIFLAALLLSGCVLYLYMETRSYAVTFLPGIYLANEGLDGLTYEQGVAKLKTLEKRKLEDFVYTIECEEDAYTLTAEDLGMVYDTEATLAPLYAIGRGENLLQRFLTIRRLRMQHVNAEPVMTYEISPVQTLLEKIRDDYTADPVDATVAFDAVSSAPFVYTDELQGKRVETSKALSEIEAAIKAGTSGTTEVETKLIEPKVKRESLEANLQILSRITVSLGTDAGAAENAELALLQFSGRRIEPGQSISFNETVGPRTDENGYVHAPEPAYGIDVSGVGGGICQASSLLYQGALMAGLEVEERHPAAVLVSFCIPGEEATVSDQGLDLRLRNPTDYSVFIRCRIYFEDGIKTACLEFFGQRQTDRLMIAHEVDVISPPEEPVYVLDRSGTHAVYNDEFVPRNEAKDGEVVVSYLVHRDKSGTEISREQLSEDRYEPLAASYWVGAQPR